jgi:hypothetical protein
MKRGLAGLAAAAVVLCWVTMGGAQTFPCTGSVFNDVNSLMAEPPVGELFCGFIEEFYRRGITSGCQADNPLTPENEAMYCHDMGVTREQMAVFVTRAMDNGLGPRNGTKVGPNLYDVHTRVLWDLGMLTNSGHLDGNGFFSYNQTPRNLVYGANTTTFLGPFGYGTPDIPPNATRKVRLYVNYGHQMQCGGTPTVKIVSGANQVEFSLPLIGGLYSDVAANWSDFKDFSQYQNIGHGQIQVYMKDFVDQGPDCNPAGSMGVIYRVEMHHYDQY